MSNNLKKQLTGKIAPKATSWKEKAKERLAKPWLREYSAKIALRILAAIEDKEDMSQATLARNMDVTPQQISKMVKGKENLTLETIYKLSKALDTELISFPDYKYSNCSLLGSYVSVVDVRQPIKITGKRMAIIEADEWCQANPIEVGAELKPIVNPAYNLVA